MNIRSMQPQDLSLVWRLAQAGDLKAQEEVVQRYQSRVAGFVYTFMDSTSAVDDLTQQIFLKALLALPRIKSLDLVESWLFRIARNTCLSYLRKQRWQRLFVPFDNEYHESMVEVPEDRTEDLAWLRKEILQLPPAQRELVAILQDRDLSYEELAQITGKSVSSVKSLLFRAREALKQRRKDES